MLAEGLRAALIEDAGVSAIVGTRVYPQVAPQGAASPYLVYSQVSGAREWDLDCVAGLGNPVFQVTAWADTYAAAQALADAVRAAVSAASAAGDLGGETIQGATIENEIDQFEEPAGGRGRGIYGKLIEVEIWLGE